MKLRILISLFTLLFVLSCGSPKIELPEKEPVAMSQEGNRLVHAGIKYKEAGDLAMAEKKFLNAIDENSSNVVAYYELSDTYLLKGDCENSLKFAYKGLEFDSDLYSRIAINASKCFRISGQSDKAIKVLTIAIDRSSDQYDLYLERAESYKKAARYDSAKYDLAIYTRLRPLDQQGHIDLGDIYKYKLDFENALAIYYVALLMDPNTETSRRLIENCRFIVEESLIRKKPNEIDFKEEIVKLSKAKIKNALKRGELYGLYSDFYDALFEAKYFDEFIYFIHNESNYPGVKDWIIENEKELEKFYDWVNKYDFHS